MSNTPRTVLDAGVVIAASVALLWVGGAGAIADQSPPSPPVVERSPVAPVTPPARDRDCADFPNQAAAQAALAPGDPERLDADADGIACEDAFGTEGNQVAVAPVGGVDTGGTAG
ncbi:MAG TPA: excalibur calcium-binding domain-containing protein [Pseudonocardia sp.]|nr:excalibur calcium-binding domain-containing protein [Pseudonocardia sp.]